MRLCIHGNMTWSLSFDTRTSAEPPRTWRCVIHQQMHVQCTNTEYKYIHLYKEYTCCTKITHSCTKVHTVVQRCTQLYKGAYSCTKMYTVVQMYTVIQMYTVVQRYTHLYKGAHSCTTWLHNYCRASVISQFYLTITEIKLLCKYRF